MNDHLKDELDALLLALEAEGVTMPDDSRALAAALEDALETGRQLTDPDTAAIAALLDGRLDDASRTNLVAVLSRSAQARADLTASAETLQVLSGAASRPPAAVVGRARAILASPAPALGSAPRRPWRAMLAAPHRRWELALGAVAGLGLLMIVTPSPWTEPPRLTPVAAAPDAAPVAPTRTPAQRDEPVEVPSSAPSAAESGHASPTPPQRLAPQASVASPSAKSAAPAESAAFTSAQPPPAQPAPAPVPSPAPPPIAPAMTNSSAPRASAAGQNVGMARQRAEAVAEDDDRCPPGFDERVVTAARAKGDATADETEQTPASQAVRCKATPRPARETSTKSPNIPVTPEAATTTGAAKRATPEARPGDID